MRTSCPAVMTDPEVKWTANLAIRTDFGRWPAVIFIPVVVYQRMTQLMSMFTSNKKTFENVAGCRDTRTAKSKETRGMIEHNSEVYNHPSLVPRPETARRKGSGFHCLHMRLIICNRITYS